MSDEIVIYNKQKKFNDFFLKYVVLHLKKLASQRKLFQNCCLFRYLHIRYDSCIIIRSKLCLEPFLWLWQDSRCLERWWGTRKGQTLSWQRWTAGRGCDTCVPAQRYVGPLRYKLQSGFDNWTKAIRASANSICHKSPGLLRRDDEARILEGRRTLLQCNAYSLALL